MSHTPFGYKIENGVAVIDEAASKQVIKVYEYYLSGDSLANTPKNAGIRSSHSSISKMLRNTLDCLKYIRQLKDKTVAVFFEKKNINFTDSKG